MRLLCYAGYMPFSDRQLLDSLSRMSFIDSAELAGILGEPHATVHRALTSLLADGIVGRVSHGTAHLPSSGRYHLTAQGIGEAAGILGFGTPSDFVRSYPMSREWLTLLIRRMAAAAAVYRIAASLSPGIDGLRSHVEFHPPSAGERVALTCLRLYLRPRVHRPAGSAPANEGPSSLCSTPCTQGHQ